ncbi:protein of unknown function [endosymbiont DhMRE of Dentiscutata heterogama]|uniref:hypothetical protein n=1 Tax=endosymbiont DhMRE of Dentiscutata heterogama TaxID=1609546 RepID=UPI000629D7EA|nr:hypothetical protein [endosymbiont DhMRE of Dentiscutata heterogama]CFW93132.1 protein of unknown function [endosymbiont DhMRE of Dentiscutata heterogama]
MVNQNLYQGFSEAFLKKVITASGKKINVTGKDYYQILSLKADELLNQEVEKKQTGSNAGDTYNEAGTKIRKAYLRAVIKAHPDRGGTSDQRMLVEEAWTILINNAAKLEYDKIYRNNISDVASDAIRRKTKERLAELANRTDPSGGSMTNDGSTGQEWGGQSVDVSRWKATCFPSNAFIAGRVDGATSKKYLGRFANFVVYVYGKLRPLQTELWGEGHLSNRIINETELGAYANFKQEVWKKNSLDEVNDYLEKVENALKDAALKGGPTTEQAAQAVNLTKLKNLPD